MLIKNGNVLTDEWHFMNMDIVISDGIIAGIFPSGELPVQPRLQQEDVYDAKGLYVLPGLVDIHIHACAGYDFSDAGEEAVIGMARYLIKQGITSFTATSMAAGPDHLEKIFRIAKELIRSGIPGGAQLRGIHMEGPFFSKERKGAQNGEYITNASIDVFDRLYAASGGNICLVDVAPELPSGLDFIQHASKVTKVSIGHTNADYETARAAFDCGATHVTHLFNAMSPFSHREPGVVGAASDAGVTVELICDGVHLHPSVIRSVFKWFGVDKVVLISDSMRACGLPDGDYELGGQAVHIAEGRAELRDGTIAGSVSNLFLNMKRVADCGIPLTAAVRAASLNPAKVIGIDTDVGSLSVGKRADIIITDRNLSVVRVISGGATAFECSRQSEQSAVPEKNRNGTNEN